MRFNVFSWNHIKKRCKKLITKGPAFDFGMDDIARIRQEIATLLDRLVAKYREVKGDDHDTSDGEVMVRVNKDSDREVLEIIDDDEPPRGEIPEVEGIGQPESRPAGGPDFEPDIPDEGPDEGRATSTSAAPGDQDDEEDISLEEAWPGADQFFVDALREIREAFEDPVEPDEGPDEGRATPTSAAPGDQDDEEDISLEEAWPGADQFFVDALREIREAFEDPVE